MVWRRAIDKTCSWSRVPLRVNGVGLEKTHVTASRALTPVEKTYVTASRTLTPVEKLICGSIKAGGPISVSTYMQFCLSHPTEGYYMKQRPDDTDVFGVEGDFITSPEISQVFGELVAIWLLSQWRDPRTGDVFGSKIRLVELGPGRGTLMDDILRTFSNWSYAKVALSSIHLVETSPAMRSRQDKKLAPWRDKHGFHLQWHNSIDDIPKASDDEFTMIVAHEFFDALPVHVLEKTPDGFREVLVDLRPEQINPSEVATSNSGVTSSQPSRSSFRFVLSPVPTMRSKLLSAMSPRFENLPLGSRVEISSTGWRIVRKLGEMVSHSATEGIGASPRGAALIIDYGGEHASGTSMRAFRAHRIVDLFDEPGMSDLTTNVDFTFLTEALRDVATAHGPIQQSKFLLRMGLVQRLAALMRQAPDEQRRSEIERAGRRLIDRAGQGMGAVYQVLGVTGPRGGQKHEIWPFVLGDNR